MVMYEYPTAADKTARRRELVSDLAKKRKLKRRAFVSLAVCVCILAIGITAEGVVAKLAICLLGAVAAGINLCAYAFALNSFSAIDKESTVISEEGFVHKTTSMLGREQTFFVRFEDILKTRQNSHGAFVIDLKSGESITVPFRVTRTKLYLIDNLSEAMKYPKKDYVSFDDYDDYDNDSNDRKDWVDRL